MAAATDDAAWSHQLETWNQLHGTSFYMELAAVCFEPI